MDVLVALLNARSALQARWEEFEVNVGINQLQRLQNLALAIYWSDFETQAAVIRQADDAFRTERSNKTAFAEWLDEEGVELVSHHRIAAKLVEKTLRCAQKTQEAPTQHLGKILERWEAKALAKSEYQKPLRRKPSKKQAKKHLARP